MVYPSQQAMTRTEQSHQMARGYSSVKRAFTFIPASAHVSLLKFPQRLLRFLPRDRGRRLIDERLQRRDHLRPADPLQRERGEPAKLLIFVAQRGDQLTDGFRRALPAQGEQTTEALAAVALRRRRDQDRLRCRLRSRRGAGGLCLSRCSRCGCYSAEQGRLVGLLFGL